MPPEFDWLLRVEHMLEAIAAIERYMADMQENDLTRDPVRRDVIPWNLQVLGEAAKHIPEQVRSKNPDFPWILARKLQNMIVHHYERIRMDIVWQTPCADIPILKQSLLDLQKQPQGN